MNNSFFNILNFINDSCFLFIQRTGNTVAVKVYNDKFYRNPQLERELDILMKIDHRNVVKLIKDEVNFLI